MSKEVKIQRFPVSSNRSLKAFSAADEYILELASDHLNPSSRIVILNDRFGYLSLRLRTYDPIIITHFKSQEDAIVRNYALNEFEIDINDFKHLLNDKKDTADLILMKIPKAIDLFHLFLIEAHKLCKSDSIVFCGFMTRHFTKQMIEVANLYFDKVEQSLAKKKSRVLMLSSPKMREIQIEPINTISFLNHRNEALSFTQYFGVFSAKHIDYATQFLLQHLHVDSSVNRVLDLACGNGVIAHEVRAQSKEAEIHLLDDSYLAIESSKLNLTEGQNRFHYNYNLDHFESQYFDLVVCNPPFHFEHENTIEIALNLFEGVARILEEDGTFTLVSNLHLNYRIHLLKFFDHVDQLNQNSKFEILICSNPRKGVRYD